jgi:putative Mg2+ transporter-C (MgtC) family protein
METIFRGLESLGLQSLTLQAVFLRLLMATVFGGCLGLERSKKRRAAGFRTYILVCAGSALIMMTAQFMQMHFSNTDPARLGAQIISGIGFLGAGSIIVTGTRQIKGLTTAAGLWASACLGIAIGIGFYLGAVLMFLLMVLVMTVFYMVEQRYISVSRTMHVYAVFETIHNISDFIRFAEQRNISVENYDTARSEYGVGIGVFFILRFPEKREHHTVIEQMRQCDGLIFLEER